MTRVYLDGGTVRHGHDVAKARLLQRQLVNLTLHDDDPLLVDDIVQPIQDLLRALHLPEGLVGPAVLDVDELAVAVVGERHGRHLGQG